MLIYFLYILFLCFSETYWTVLIFTYPHFFFLLHSLLNTLLVEDLDALLGEVNEGRARDLQEGSSCPVICPLPRVGLEKQRRLNRIHQMHPGLGRGEQRASHSKPYIQRTSSRHPSTLQGPGGPREQSTSPLTSTSGAIDSSLWGASPIPVGKPGQPGLVLQGEDLVWMPGGELGLWICNPPEGLLAL